MTENEISKAIIGKAIEVHKILGPGLLESVYEKALAYDLEESGFRVQQQLVLPVQYRDLKIKAGYRVDLFVEEKVIVEVKALEEVAKVHHAQLLTYLRLSGVKLGLLINFNKKYLKQGIHRIVNDL